MWSMWMVNYHMNSFRHQLAERQLDQLAVGNRIGAESSDPVMIGNSPVLEGSTFSSLTMCSICRIELPTSTAAVTAHLQSHGHGKAVRDAESNRLPPADAALEEELAPEQTRENDSDNEVSELSAESDEGDLDNEL